MLEIRDGRRHHITKTTSTSTHNRSSISFGPFSLQRHPFRTFALSLNYLRLDSVHMNIVPFSFSFPDAFTASTAERHADMQASPYGAKRMPLLGPLLYTLLLPSSFTAAPYRRCRMPHRSEWRNSDVSGWAIETIEFGWNLG